MDGRERKHSGRWRTGDITAGRHRPVLHCRQQNKTHPGGAEEEMQEKEDYDTVNLSLKQMKALLKKKNQWKTVTFNFSSFQAVVAFDGYILNCISVFYTLLETEFFSSLNIIKVVTAFKSTFKFWGIKVSDIIYTVHLLFTRICDNQVRRK